jgi:Ulp1 family protease
LGSTSSVITTNDSCGVFVCRSILYFLNKLNRDFFHSSLKIFHPIKSF